MNNPTKYSKYLAVLLLGLMLLAWLLTPSLNLRPVQASYGALQKEQGQNSEKEQGLKPEGDARTDGGEVKAIPL